MLHSIYIYIYFNIPVDYFLFRRIQLHLFSFKVLAELWGYQMVTCWTVRMKILDYPWDPCRREQVSFSWSTLGSSIGQHKELPLTWRCRDVQLIEQNTEERARVDSILKRLCSWKAEGSQRVSLALVTCQAYCYPPHLLNLKYFSCFSLYGCVS